MGLNNKKGRTPMKVNIEPVQRKESGQCWKDNKWERRLLTHPSQ